MDCDLALLQRRRHLVRRMAWLCAALMLCIISLSAYMRLSKEAVRCAPWPQCQVQALGADGTATPAPTQTPAALKLVHRVVASATLLVLLLMLVVSATSTPRLWPESRGTLILLVLAIFLAVLGRWSAQPGLPGVVLGNLLAGLLMFALAIRLVCVAGGSRAQSMRGGMMGAWICMLLICLQVLLGGLVSARHAGLSCPVFGACVADASGGLGALLSWVSPSATALTQEQGAFLQLAHRIAGVALVAVLWAFSWRLWRADRRGVAAAVALLAALQPLVGLVVVAWQQPLPLVLLHNLLAAALLALLAAQTVRVER